MALSCGPTLVAVQHRVAGRVFVVRPPEHLSVMDPTAFPLYDLAKRLLASERGGDGGMPGSSVVCVCAKLGIVLSKLAGAAGYRSLLSRALVLAQAFAPALKSVHVSPDGTLEGLAEAKAATSNEELELGEIAIVVQLLSLLRTFIGEPLVQQLVKEAWPAIDPTSSTDSPIQ